MKYSLLFLALCFSETICLRFLGENIIFRGGIAYGDAYVDPEKGMFFGPAVNKAYQLESQAAVYPRIVVDYASCRTGIREAVIEEQLIEKDLDGNYIFNYLHYPQRDFQGKFPMDGYYKSPEEFVEKIKNACLEQFCDKVLKEHNELKKQHAM